MPDVRPDTFLLISQSGRALAQAALRAGRTVVGVDGFADGDTCDMARDWRRVSLDENGELDFPALEAATAELCPTSRCLGLVYGSGFESRPERLGQLARGRPLMGNRPDVLALSSDPMRFAELCRALELPIPATRLAAPENRRGWLNKRAGGCGGFHVRDAAQAAPPQPGTYFQRRIDGQPCSLLFLAEGKNIRSLGFNRLLSAPAEAPTRWAYAGATTLAEAPSGVGPAVLAAARALTRTLGLKGLNGIDFIVHGRAWSLLELNPRPTATVELWDIDPMPPLFDLHLEGCLGRLPADLPGLPGSRAVAVVYAGDRLQVPVGFAWPEWCADLPAVGTLLRAGDPVCTVRAEGTDTAIAEQRVLTRRLRIVKRLRRYGQPKLAKPLCRPAPIAGHSRQEPCVQPS